MDTKLIRSVIDLIRDEERRMIDKLPSENVNAAYDQYVFTDLPFVNELYLMLLVAMWHHIEKELLYLAARADGSTNEITWDDYETAVKNLAKMQPRLRWSTIKERLRLEGTPDYGILKLQQNLANAYKHDPFGRPGKKILKCLNLPTDDSYASFPESEAIAEGFCKLLGIDPAGGYAGIIEAFLKASERVLIELKSKTKLRPVKTEKVSLTEFAR